MPPISNLNVQVGLHQAGAGQIGTAPLQPGGPRLPLVARCAPHGDGGGGTGALPLAFAEYFSLKIIIPAF